MSNLAWKDAWTGGQYSVVRALVGVTVGGVLATTAFLDHDGFPLYSAALVLASLGFAAGFGGGAFAVVFATLAPFELGEWAETAAGYVVGLWFFLHLAMPRAPYGSLAARGRLDPRGTWTMPGWYPPCCQFLFVLTRFGYAMDASMNGQTMIAAAFIVPGVLGFARRSEFLAWGLSFALEIALAATGSGTAAGAFLLHVVTFQPAWIPRSSSDDFATVFYDGSCALCHAAVRFLVAEDRDPARFRIAPLGGAAYLARVPERVRVNRPDSVLLIRGTEVLMRGAAVEAILTELGGVWAVVAALMGLFPRSFVDRVYDAIAARRYAWFGRKTAACPVLPPPLRLRFEP